MDVGIVRSRAGGAVRLLAAMAGLTAPPVLLATIVGNPLPDVPIDWSTVVESIQAGLVPSSVWVNVLAALAWATWAILVGMLTLEVVAVARNRPSSAAVPGWIRRLAQVLVAATLALTGPTQQPLAAAITGASFVAAAAPVEPSASQSAVEEDPMVEGRLVTVGEGDSWSRFAADVLGDATLGPQLREANLGRHVGDGDTISPETPFVEPGWQLIIPPHLDLAAPVGEPIGTEADAADAGQHLAGMWEIERGDHFWGIAERTLAEAWGRAPADAEIVPYWREVVDANRDRLRPPGDPDLIYPGQEFVIPPPPEDPLSPEPPAGLEPPNETDSSDDGWRAAIEGDDHTGGPEGDESEPRSGWQEAIESSGSAESADAAEPADVEDPPRTPSGLPIGLTAGVAASSLLAAGVVAALRWRRRTALQQRLPGLRLPTPLPEAQAQAAKLEAAAAPEATLDDLAAMLASIPTDAYPVLVTVADDGEITLLFDEQDELPDPPAPWTLAYDGSAGPVGWRATLGSRGPERSIGLPLLVTLGRTGTATILANVAAMGTLVLTGNEPQVGRRLRTAGLEVATSRVSVPVEVAVAGDDRLATLDQVRHIDDPADEVRLSMEEVEQDIVLDDRTPRLLVCHADIDPPMLLEELRGMVGVMSATPADDAWILDVDDERTGRLHLPGGGTVKLALPDIDPDVIDYELTRLEQPATEPVEQAAEPVGSTHGDPSTNGHKPSAPRSAADPAWCEVRILGPVQVVVDGRKVQDLTPKLLEVLAYLATHRDGVSKDRVDTDVWAGCEASTGRSTQRVKSALSKIRQALGDGPDGEFLLPRRHGDQLIDLSPHVGCDLDRAMAHLDLARDLPAEARTRELVAALDVARGEPFQGRTYSWATEVAQHAIVRLQDAAVEAARALREAGELDAAAEVIRKGHLLLNANGWLYLEQAEVEKARGHPERAARTYEEYRTALADDADEIAGSIASPPREIELAFRELMATA